MLIILLLRISLLVEGIEIEVLDPLKAYQEDLIVAGDVRVVDGSEILSLHGSKSERVFAHRQIPPTVLFEGSRR